MSIFFSCTSEKVTSISPVFYHWQTHLQLTFSERQLMDSLNVEKIYAKFFDIDLSGNNQPVPNAQIKIDTQYLNNIELVPTVFITNRVFKNISEKEIEKLADNIFNKIKELNGGGPMEIQFDCDWTKTTKNNYFYFLKTIKSNFANIKISATIRLHQLKFPKETGVPPVDKGMLMFYNVGELGVWETENSILNLTIAEKYLMPNARYPLHLDIALPIFKWGVVFRNGELVYLINDLGGNEIINFGRFEKINRNRYKVIESHYLKGYYLYEGDLIRLEETTPTLLEGAAKLLKAKFPYLNKSKNAVLSFYHLDTTTLEVFKYHDFKKIIESF